MAVTAIHKDTKVKIVMNAGFDDNNRQIKKRKTLNKARPETENEVLFKIAEKTASLQKHSLTDIIRHDEYRLAEE